MVPSIFNHSLVLLLMYSLLVVTGASRPMNSTAALCHDHERSALLQFKQSLSLNKSASYESSAYAKTKSWKHRGEMSSDCCSWSGVECDNNTGYVIGLHLSSSYLYGNLPSNSTIFTLVHLQTLDLHDNDFNHSPIPPRITHLLSLTSLDLSFSAFSGQIPLELSGLSQLTSLDLSRNKLSGNLPNSIGNLQSLTKLRLGDCHFSGLIPVSIGNLTQLTELSLSRNLFSKQGKVSWLEKLTKLTILGLEKANLYGNIPFSLANLTQLAYLNLDSNYFAGEIPLWLMNMTHLTHLSLELNNLTGLIPSSFSQLKNLEYLDLSGNKFSGNLPDSIGNLQSLTELRLKECHFSGSFPAWIGNLTQLAILYLDSNYFAGEIPFWLMNMTHLTDISLAFNNLTGPIPSSFSQLKNLEYLDLYKNNLIGAVEANIFLNLTKLTYLSLSNNNITLLTHHHINSTLSKLQNLELDTCNLGEIPRFLQFQNELEELFLAGNNIHGKIPHWIWNISSHLEGIDLSGNFFTAMDQNPIALTNSSSLGVIDVSNNMLQGNLPVPPPTAVDFHISDNNLTGNIPPMICGCMSLLILDLSHNNMSGPIPQCLANSLEALILEDNKFSGTIPRIYPKNCKLRLLDVSRNQLTGEVPKSLLNCKMLQIIDLSDNLMEQNFPNWLRTLPQLQVLLLRSNKFYGAMGSPTIPTEFPMLRIIDLSHNFLIGDLPVDYIKVWNSMKVIRQDSQLYINTDASFETQSVTWTGNYPSSIILTNKGVKTKYEKILNIFTSIDLSSNKFTGHIPESLGNLEALQSLNLSSNELTGPIPSSLGNLRQLESLDLSLNKLSGVIPHQFAANLKFLAFFNVSYNLLFGHIPQGSQFETFENSSYMMNSGLCGLPLSNTCGSPQSPPADDGDEEEDESDADVFHGGFIWVFILAGLGSGLVVGIVMGNIFVDRYPWLISGAIQNLGWTLKNRRRPKRQNIRD